MMKQWSQANLAWWGDEGSARVLLQVGGRQNVSGSGECRDLPPPLSILIEDDTRIFTTFACSSAPAFSLSNIAETKALLHEAASDT